MSEIPPIPPLELRKMVGPSDEVYFDNPNGGFTWGPLEIGPLAAGDAYRRVFDFGCGCGRNARQLMLQKMPPDEYVGIDVSKRLLNWCQEHLAPYNTNFSFLHHDVLSATYAPDNTPNRVLPFPTTERKFTLVNAHSVFTHLYLDQTIFYLRECARVLDADTGIIRSTWFLFNKDWFPMLSPSQFCLFVSETDPTQAVYYDWYWLAAVAQSLKLKIIRANWARTRGHQNEIYFALGNRFQDITHFVRPAPEVIGF